MTASMAFWNRHFLWVSALALAFAYWGMRRNAAVYDDPVYIQENPGIKSLRNLPKLFTREYSEVSMDRKAYRPVPVALRMLAWQAVGDSPAGHRSLNLLVHWLNACLTFFLCRRHFFPESAAPLWAAFLFALHPAASESLLCATFLYAPMSFLFCLGSLWSYLEARQLTGEKRVLWSALSWALFSLASLSKETAALFPLWLAAYEMLHPAPDGSRRPYGLLASFLAPILGYALIRFSLFGEYASAPYIGGTFYTNLLTSLKTVPLYARLILWPHPLSINYRVPAAGSALEVGVLLSFAVLAALAWLGWLLWRRDRTALFWLLGLLWPMAVVMNWVPFFDEVTLLNERHLYFTLASFAVLAGLGIERLGRILGTAIWPRAAGAAVLAAYAGLVMARVPDWRSEVTLHEQAVRVSPDSYKAYNDLGWAYYRQGDMARAEASYLEALRLFPGLAVCARLAVLYERQGRFQDAARVLEAALQVADELSLKHYGLPGQMARVQFKLGNSRLKTNDLRGAALAYERAVQLDPSLDGAYHNLGLVYAALGRPADAAVAFERALSLNPGNEVARKQLLRLGKRR